MRGLTFVEKSPNFGTLIIFAEYPFFCFDKNLKEKDGSPCVFLKNYKEMVRYFPSSPIKVTFFHTF
jgi:hypothetical protein